VRIKVANLVLTMVWFRDDNLLWIKASRNFQGDMVI